MAIKTSGDGNCLVHAVALALWGQHDRTLVSRKVHAFLAYLRAWSI